MCLVFRVPKLLSFVYGTDGHVVPQPPAEIAGNALDVTAIDGSGHILVAVDNVHDPSSTRTRRSAPSSPEQLLQEFKLSNESGCLKWEKVSSLAVDTVNKNGTTAIPIIGDEKGANKQSQSLVDSLYGLTNLRKKD